MPPGIVIIAVVAIVGGLITDVIKTHYKAKAQHSAGAEELKRLRDELKRLEGQLKDSDLGHRVECLETIVNDTDFKINRVLERLERPDPGRPDPGRPDPGRPDPGRPN